MHPISKILQSKSDPRLYKHLFLPNNLSCLLISDVATEKSAAALSVQVGSLEDPLLYPGLAHFLEHMLFLGTAKYPKENDYKVFLAQNGGSMNAFTSSMETCYYFGVGNGGFEGALDRFAQFFREPLFNEDCTMREMQAVHSEHQKNLTNDAWRLLQLTRSSALQGNVYNRFQTGDLETLNKPGIREALLAFHKKYYSSNLMNLVLYGRDPIEKLEQYAMEMFNPIKNNDSPKNTYTEKPFVSDNLGNLFKIVPINDDNYLRIVWYIDWLKPYYEKSPGSYLSHIFGHEGTHSLLSFLIEEDLALELTAGNSDENNLFSKFEITIRLTDKGLAHYQDVCEIVFQFLKIVKEKGPQEYLFREKQYINQLKFDFKDKERPDNYVIPLSLSLASYPIEHILIQPYLLTTYDPELIQKTVDSFTLENMRIYLISKSVEPEATQTEPIYQTKYVESKFDEGIIKRFTSPKYTPQDKNKKILDLPVANIFLPRDFQIQKDEVTEKPIKILENEKTLAFFQQDGKFNIPKAVIHCRILMENGAFPQDPKHFIAAKMWNKMVHNELREIIYQAEMANLNCSFYIHSLGMDLIFSGFNDGLPLFVEAIFSEICSFSPPASSSIHQAQFTSLHNSMSKEYKNFYKSQPYSLNSHFQKVFLKTGPIFDVPVLQSSLESLDYESFLKIIPSMLSTIRFEWLALGNLKKDQIKNLLINIENKVNSKNLETDKVCQIRSIRLEKQEKFFFEHFIEEQRQNNSSLSLFLQNPNDPPLLEDYLLCQLLVDILKEPFFSQLRTEEQLGYIVSSSSVDDRGIFSLCFIVQSERKSSHFLAERVEEFLRKQKENILAVEEEIFEKFRKSLVVKVGEKDLNIFQVAGRFWDEIVKHNYNFEKQEKNVEFLKKLTRKDFIDFADKILYSERRKFEFHSVCPMHKDQNNVLKEHRLKEEGIIEVLSYDEFKKGRKTFPDFYSYHKN